MRGTIYTCTDIGLPKLGIGLEFDSGAGTHLKLGGHIRWKAPEKFFSCLHFFGSTSSISRFGERFRDGQYSLVSFLFTVFLLVVPTSPAMCKSRGHVPPCPMESVPLELEISL